MKTGKFLYKSVLYFMILTTNISAMNGEDFFVCSGTSSKLPKYLLESSKPFDSILSSGVLTKVRSTYCEYGTDRILVTSDAQADKCFDMISKLFADKDYHAAIKGVEILIFSITEGTLPYSVVKFERYKNLLASLVVHKNEPALPLNLEPTLSFIAARVIEFISEQQKDMKAAEAYAKLLIQEACKSIDEGDFLYSMLCIWCKFHEKYGTLDAGMAFVEQITRYLAANPGAQIFLPPTPLTGLDILVDYTDKIGADIVIKKSREIIDTLFSNTFKAISTYSVLHQVEIINYLMAVLGYFKSAVKKMSLDECYQDERMEYEAQIALIQKALKGGVSGIIGLSQKKLGRDILNFSTELSVLMDEESSAQFLDHIKKQLIKVGFSEQEISDYLESCQDSDDL